MKKLLPVVAFLCLTSWVASAAPQIQDESVKITLGPEWVAAHSASDSSTSIIEFVREGDDINSWKELVTIQTFRGPTKSSPEEFLGHLKALREKECPGATEWNVIAQDENSISYEWQAKPCLGWPDQHEIARMIAGKYDWYLLRYTAKVLELAPDIRAQWTKTFSDATFDPTTSSFNQTAGSQDVGMERLKFKLDPDWSIIGSDKDSRGLVHVLYLRQGDDIHNWKELFTYHSGPRKSNLKSPEEEFNIIKADTDKHCPGATVWNVIEQDENSILFEFQSKPCKGGLELSAIFRIIQGKNNWFDLSYSARAYGLAPDTRTKWIATLKDATITTDSSADLLDPNAESKNQEAPVTSAKTPSQAGVSSGVAQGDVQDTTPIDFANWGHNPAPGARLELKEVGRKQTDGGTEISYHAEGSGFPAGKTYALWWMLSGDRGTLSLSTGYLANATGMLVCPGQSQPGDHPQANSQCTPLEHTSLDIEHYHKGEPVDFAIVSTDGTVRAYARAYPFPIQAQDGKCTLNVEIENTKFTSFIIRGAGFEPGENVKTSSSFGGDTTPGTQQASSKGEFAAAAQADLRGKNSGSATFTAAGISCSPTVTYDWGKAAKKVQ